MNRYLEAEPATDAALFDMVHGLFGVGDFNDSSIENPWWKFRAREIAKLKTIRKKRQVTLRDFALAARYCFTNRIAVRETYQLCPHLLDAKREARLRRVSDLAQGIASAVEIERGKSQPDTKVIERLLLAQNTGRQVVLDEWLEANS